MDKNVYAIRKMYLKITAVLIEYFLNMYEDYFFKY